METRKARAALLVVAVTLVTAGAVVLGASVVAPEVTETAYGAVKRTVTAQVDLVRETVFEELPTVALGATGGMAELDRCDGTFTEIAAYQREGVPPVWAAHNNCGGDVTLAWERGQRVSISGSDAVYEVVEVRAVSKTWSSTDDLVGLSGELALQTCFYGENRMKFVALSLVG